MMLFATLRAPAVMVTTLCIASLLLTGCGKKEPPKAPPPPAVDYVKKMDDEIAEYSKKRRAEIEAEMNTETPASSDKAAAAAASDKTTPGSSPSAIFKQNEDSVVVVRADGSSQGSGVVIGTDTVVTNCHVASRASQVTVIFKGQSIPAKVAFRDQGHDLCQLNAPGLRAKAVEISTVRSLSVGDRVYAIGAPQGLTLTLSDGLVSSLRPHDGSQIIQTTAAISPGSSGGGLFDGRGRLVGITTFQSRTGQNLNFAVPADWIAQIERRHGNNESLLPESASSGSPPTQVKSAAIVGQWHCRSGAAQNKIQQFEFMDNGVVTTRFMTDRGWTSGAGRYRLLSETSLAMELDRRMIVNVLELTSNKMILEYSLGAQVKQVCERS
jgi:serine protease Do